jgi:hypothetical protein
MIDRELIWSTFFDLVKTAPGLITTSRRLKHFSEVAMSEQPALFLIQTNDDLKVVHGVPTVSALNGQIILYGHNQGIADVSPMTSLNPIIDAILAKLMPPHSTVPFEQTLGGLVERCRIDGGVITDEGVLGDQSIVVMPVKILTLD